MAVYKDKNGTWYVSARYTNWKGEADALYGLLHTVIVSHTERVVWKWMELRQFDLLNHFQGFFLTHNTSLLTEYGVFVKVHNGCVRLCKKHIYLFSTPQCAYPFG